MRFHQVSFSQFWGLGAGQIHSLGKGGRKGDHGLTDHGLI